MSAHTSDGPESTPSRTWSRFSEVVVYGVFSVLAVGLAVYLRRYGRNLPYWDDWELVPVLSGHEHAGPSWVWAQQNEHRFPLVRLAVILVWRVTHDLRVVMVLTNLLLCAIAFAFIQTARTIRGRTVLGDALFPLALMTLAHYESLISTLQLFYALAVAIAVAFVLLAAAGRWRSQTGIAGALALLVVASVLNGAIGLVLAVPMVGWSAAAARAHWNDADGAARRAATLFALSVAVAVALAGLYFVGLQRVSGSPPPGGLIASARTLSENLGGGFGAAGREAWPWSVIPVAIVAAAGSAVAVRAALRREARLQALAVLCGIAAFLAVMLAIAYGRSGFGAGSGFSIRYAIFAAVLVCLSYIGLVLFAPSRVASVVGIVLSSLFLASLPASTSEGIDYGRFRADTADALVREARRGVPPALLAEHFTNRVYPDTRRLGSLLELLRESHDPPFNGPNLARCDTQEEVPVAIVETHDLRADGPSWAATGGDPFLVLALPASRRVCAVEVTFVITTPTPSRVPLEAFWMLTGVNAFAPVERSDVQAVDSSPVEQTVTYWIGEPIDRLRLDPGSAPVEVDIRRVVLLDRVDAM